MMPDPSFLPPTSGSLTSPYEHEAEAASNSYLMSLVAVMVGLPMPIINLIATGIYFLAHRRSSYFVRWHCMHALLAQAITLPVNIAGVYWTISVVFARTEIGNNYIAYMITVLLANIFEFSAIIYAAVHTRRGEHVEWWLFGPLTSLLVRPAK